MKKLFKFFYAYTYLTKTRHMVEFHLRFLTNYSYGLWNDSKIKSIEEARQHKLDLLKKETAKQESNLLNNISTCGIILIELNERRLNGWKTLLRFTRK